MNDEIREWNGTNDAFDNGLEIGRREAAEELMGRLRAAGVADDGWNGGDVVEVVDGWLTDQGVDTSVRLCPLCEDSLANTDEAVLKHYRTAHPDDDPAADGFGKRYIGGVYDEESNG